MKKKTILIIACLVTLASIVLGLSLPSNEAAEIKLNSDVLFNIYGFAFTNSMAATWATMLILIILGIFIKLTINIKPGKLQLILEIIINFFYEKLNLATESKRDTSIFLPMVSTVFLLFLIGNQFSLLPIISNLTYNGVAVFRTPSADFSLTIAATLVILGTAQLVVIFRRPIRHFLNFIRLDKLIQIRKAKDIPNVMLELFLGVMDIIGEIAKMISMSARLFGNVAAGELMVLVISGLAVFTTFIVPIPFVFLSSFSGIIQAFVFGLLAVQFSALTLNSIKETSNQ